MKKRFNKFLTLLAVLLLGFGQMWGGDAFPKVDNFENNSCNYSKSNASSIGVNSTKAHVRTGSYSVVLDLNTSSTGPYSKRSTKFSFVKNTYIHAIGWFKSDDSEEFWFKLGSTDCTKKTFGGDGDWHQLTGTCSYTSSTADKDVAIYITSDKKGNNVYYDDIVYYSSTSDKIDLTYPGSPTAASATTTEINWTNTDDSGDGATGRQATLIWRRTSGSANDLTLNNQGVYSLTSSEGPSADQSGHWTLVNATVAANATSYAGTFTAGDVYAIVHRDLAYNYSSPAYVTIIAGSTYDATFDNNGHGTAPSKAEGVATVTLAEITGVSGWKNTHWIADKATKVGATDKAAGATLNHGDVVTLLENTTFTAQWGQLYTVTYNKAGGEEGDVPTQEALLNGTTFDVAGQGTLTPPNVGDLFRGWNDGIAATPYKEGDDYTIDGANVNFTAVWESPATCTIALDANGGSVASYDGWTKEGDVYSKTLTEGTEVSLLAFTKTDLQLMFFRDGSNNEYSGSITLNTNLNLKAIWGKEKEVELYYWEGKEGAAGITGETGATQRGGVATHYNGNDVYSGEKPRINYAQGGYYSLSVGSSVDYTGEHIRVALDEALKEGDEIEITGYCDKDGTKVVAPKLANASNEVICTADNVPDIHDGANGGVPTEQTKTLNASAEGATTLKLTRSTGATTVFVTKLVITGTRVVEEMDPAQTPSISAHPASASYTWKDAVAALTVTAAVTDGGTLHYQWYKEAGENDTKVGTDADSYTPEEAGTYYVIVTNKKTGYEDASATSNNAVITITVRPSYTVTYYDGATSLGTESVLDEASPIEYAAKQTRVCRDFVAWYNNSDLAEEHKIADISALVITANTPVYGKWTANYAFGDYSFVNVAEVGTAPNKLTMTDGTTVNVPAGSRVDNIYFSEMAIKYESGASDVLTDYKGWKINTENATISLLLENDAQVKVGIGQKADLNVLYTATDGTAKDVTLVQQSEGVYNAKAGTIVTLRMTSGNTTTLKYIKIGSIPAVSDINTLSYLEVDGESIPVPGNGIVYMVVPYEHIPQITDAVATDAPKATVAINNTPVHYDDGIEVYDYVQAEVTPEDPTADHGYYQIRYTNAPKLGVEIIKAVTTTANEGAATGYIGGIYKNTKTGTTVKMDKNNHFGLELAAGNAFQEGDVYAMNITAAAGGNMGTMKLYESAEATDNLYESTMIGAVGKNYWTLPNTVNNKEALYIKRGGGDDWNPTFSSISVYRLMAPFIEEFKIGDAVGTITGTNIAVEVPYNADVTALTPSVKYWANGAAQISPAIGETDFTSPVDFTVSSGYAEDATGAYAPVTYTVTVTKADHYVAQIGETRYTSLDAAVTYANANAGSEIVLLESITCDDRITLTANTTLNLNGYTFGKTNGGWLIFVKGGATLTINGETASSAVYGGISLGASTNNNGSLILNGGAYSCGENTACIHINGTCLNSNVTITGATITNAYDNAIQFNGKGIFTITDATITGATGIYIKSGELTITNSTVTGTLAPADYTYNGNGANATGDGIVVDACNYPGGAPTINIISGTFTGTKDAIGNYNYNGTSEPAVGGIQGGTFNTAVPEALCAEGYTPTSWTVGTETKYGVHLAGVIRGAASTNSDGVYYYTLDNDVTIFSSESDGRLKASNHINNSNNDVVACGGDEGKYNVNQSKFVLQFPANVKEFTLYGANSDERTISKVYVNAEASTTIKISTVGRELTGTYSTTKDGKCQALTAVFDNDNVIAANDYVLVTLSGTANIYRVLYTEAECFDPVINEISATRMKVGEQATVSVNATAVGATYQWYRCDDELGTNPQIIGEATAASYSFEKAAGDEFFKVVVGCNCSSVKAEAVVKAEEWYEVTRTNVTGYTEWNWNGIIDAPDAGPRIQEDQKGNVLASYIDAPNFDKLEGNQGAYVYRNNQYRAFQGTSLMFTTEVKGLLTINASYTNDGYTLSVNGQGLGALPKNPAAFTIAVSAGDVTLTSDGMRIWSMTFDPNIDPTKAEESTLGGYERDVTEGKYGTICLPHGGIMAGATIYTLAFYGATSQKIFFDEVLGGVMVAGKPYLFLPNEGVTRLGVYYTDEASVDEGVQPAVNGFIGFINADLEAYTPVPDDEDHYIIQNNTYRQVLAGADARIKSNRAYIKFSEISPTEPAKAPGARRIGLGKDAAQGFENLQSGDQPMKVMIDGTLYIIRGEKVYNANGQVVK